MQRQRVNKAKSAKQFTRNIKRTKAANIMDKGRAEQGPMRGGWRL